MANEKRLVDAEAIARKLKNAHCAECHVVRKVQCSACWVEAVLELLEDEAVDAVEVVRCKDCKHMNVVGVGYRWCKAWERIQTMGDDGFCCFGERKDNEEQRI